MKTNYILLFIGIVGLLVGGYGLFMQKDYTTNLVTFICGGALIWGYFQAKKAQK